MTRFGPACTEPAGLPPAGLPGLDPQWSRLVSISDHDGVQRTFHVLDSWGGRRDSAADTGSDAPAGPPGLAPGSDQVAGPAGTLLCVHGNPTWSYLWRRMLAAAPPGWRVIAADHLGMGCSERIGRPRVLAERVDDLGRLTDALGVTGPGRSAPVVTLAHDWGGIISLGWAAAHRDQLAGVILTNTAVHQPAGRRGPALIRLANVPALNRIACVETPLFVRATTSLTWPRIPRPVRRAFAQPYLTRARRLAVGDFVADIPFAPEHPSHQAVDAIAEATRGLDVPALLLWGPRDPVFGEDHLRDLRARLPRSVLHRYEKAGHLLPEDAPDYPAAVTTWIDQVVGRTIDQNRSDVDSAAPQSLSGSSLSGSLLSGSSLSGSSPGHEPDVLHELESRADDRTTAVVEIGGRQISWADLHSRVRDIAAGLARAGFRRGERVGLLVPPSIELTVALYAVWRAGGVIVVADRGLGLRGMKRALRGARLDYVIADTAGLAAARLMRLPGRRIAVRDVPPRLAAMSGTALTLPALARAGVDRPVPPDARLDDEAAVLFTSGATGPAKGVVYQHRQVRAQLTLIKKTYGLGADDRIVAAFAPFALYGPALGVPSAVPDTDVTRPATLTAAALADAAIAVRATVVFASPAALRNVVATAASMDTRQREALGRIRLLMSAGASIPPALLRSVAVILPSAEIHTPYGMTEALPLTDISLAEIETAGCGDGVCVGRPLSGVRIRIAPLDDLGIPSHVFTDRPMVTGEIWATAEHIRHSYDSSWVIDAASSEHPGWHRTGDVGHHDEAGRLWIEGRLIHVMTTASGPVTPVGIEVKVDGILAAEQLAWATPAVAAVGVGPAGAQQVVVVLSGTGGPLASNSVIDLVRGAAGVPVASVLVVGEMPVDIRHNSKVDRVAVGVWAAKVLAGR